MGKEVAVVEGAEADLFFDLGENLSQTLAVGGSVGERRLFAAAMALKIEINDQRPRFFP